MTWSRRVATPCVLLAAALLAACGGAEPEGFLLPADLGAESFSFPSPPRRAEIEIDQERRPALLTPSSGFRWRGRVPEGARLVAGYGVPPAAWRRGAGLEVLVEIDDGSGRELVEVARSAGGLPQRWSALTADLSRWGGREATLAVRVRWTGRRRGGGEGLIAWAPVALTAAARRAPAHPNVVLILVDTLRRDRLTPYGYRRDTSPEIQRRLAARGTVVEEAYAQAPWTLPSLMAVMAGRYPGEMVREDRPGFAFSLPAGIPTLAERLRGLGYRTAGFYANPTLHAGNGFARGFETFYTPPPTLESMRRHADDVTGRALPWLAAHRDRPFFLYVHYIDPHDPYDNPDVVGGRSPFDPGYPGVVGGDWIHGFYTGQLRLPDPARDLVHINALYDSEVRYVDRFVGHLLEGLGPALGETLVVLTADHGEELLDHGGWKHGQTLYDEQIRVPLIVRWDGRVPAGRRLPGTVRLLDLLPTLVGAAGGKVERESDGVDLLPALTGRGRLPRRPAFAQHLSSGPWRAAAVLEGEKAIFFNAAQPFAPADDVQAHFWRLDLARFERAELYDLARDPRERRNLAAAQPARVAALAPVVHRQLVHQTAGVWLWLPAAGALPAGARLGGSIRFERPPEGWAPYLLAPQDRVEIAGDTLRFDLAVESLVKGLLVRGTLGGLRAATLTLAGRPLLPARLHLGPGRPWRGGPTPAAVLEAAGWPPGDAPGAGGAALHLWRSRGAQAPRGAHDPETERRLRALGYIQ